MRIKVGLAQIYPKLGDLAYNLQAHLDYARQARKQQVDLLVFPELSLTGYQVQDLAPEVAIETDANNEVFGCAARRPAPRLTSSSASCIGTGASASTSPMPTCPAAKRYTCIT